MANIDAETDLEPLMEAPEPKAPPPGPGLDWFESLTEFWNEEWSSADGSV